jgi:hypothetical protein
MSFDALITKVQQAEQALEARERAASTQWQQVKTTWRESWTPGRIVIAGLASGFLVGRAQPLKLAGSGGLLNMVTALSGLLASGSAQVAAENAEQAADAAGDVAQVTGDAANGSPGVVLASDDDIAAIERAARGA